MRRVAVRMAFALALGFAAGFPWGCRLGRAKQYAETESDVFDAEETMKRARAMFASAGEAMAEAVEIRDAAEELAGVTGVALARALGQAVPESLKRWAS